MSEMLPPLSLYLHLPWCRRKCPYCDFNSHVAGSEPPYDRYVDTLVTDLGLEAGAGRASGRTLDSIFIGGGTPSLFSAAHIERLLEAATRLFGLSAEAEITIEVNPGAVEHGDLRGYFEAGVNRLSIGAQSFDPDMLGRLGRIHGPAEIRATFAAAERAGFRHINLDLMFALPGQTLSMAASDLDSLLALAPPHVSYYQLTLEPNTVFHRHPPAALPDEDLSWELQQQGHERLAAAGYERYEISAFAQAGERCWHNLNYWNFGDYLAAGAGAHGKFTDGAGRIWRYVKPAHPRSYMETLAAGNAAAVPRPVDGQDVGFEFMLNVLRLPGGFTEPLFRRHTGLTFDTIRPALRRASGKGLIERAETEAWRPTALGLRFLNDLQAEFLPG